MATDAHREGNRRYDKTNTRQVKLKLNTNTDADILAWLDQQESKQGAIKGLIRKQIGRSRDERIRAEVEAYINIERDGVEVARLRGRWETPERKAVLASAVYEPSSGAMVDTQAPYRYELEEGETYWMEDLYPEDE